MFRWLQFLTYATVTAITPGPNTMSSMSNAGRLGLKKALPFNVGIFCGLAVITPVCALFCSLLSSVIPKIKTPMLIIGAVYILYLAWKTFKSTPEMEESQTTGKGFLSGLTLQFVNPKTYLYCIVSMEAYILPYYSDQPIALVGFGLLLALIGFVFTLCWSLFGSVFKLRFSKHAKVTNTIMALLLVYCAISLFF